MSSSFLNKAKLNAFAYYIHFLFESVISFFVSPLLVQFLGVEHFGIWKVCQRFLNFASIAGGRATQALRWVIANGEGKGHDMSVEDKQRSVGSAIAFSLIFFPISFLVLASLVYVLPTLINGIKIEDIKLVRTVGIILGMNILFSPLLGLPDAILVGINRSYRSTIAHMCWLLVANLSVVYLAYLGYSLISLAAVYLIVAVLQTSTLYIICRRTVPWLGVLCPEKPQLKTFMNFSAWVLMWSFIARLLLVSEVLLIGSLVGAAAVSSFVFSSYVPQLAVAVCMKTCVAITPSLGALFGANKLDRLIEFVLATREVIYCLAIIFGGCILALNKAFVTLWVGDSYYVGDIPNLLMVVLMVQLAMLRCEGQIQDITLKIHNKVAWGAAGASLGVVLAWALYVYWLPNMSAIFIGLIAGRCVTSYRFPKMVNSFLQIKSSLSLRLVASTLLLYLCYCAGAFVRSDTWVGLIIDSIFITSLLSFLSYVLLLSKKSRLSLAGKFVSGKNDLD